MAGASPSAAVVAAGLGDAAVAAWQLQVPALLGLFLVWGYLGLGTEGLMRSVEDV